jgi:hypothetical protein
MATGVLTRIFVLLAGLALTPLASASDFPMASPHIDMHPQVETASSIAAAFPAPKTELCVGGACASAPVSLAALATPQVSAPRPSAAACINNSGQHAAVPYDIDGNCTSDLIWMNDQTHQFGWWLLYPVPDRKGDIASNISQLISVTPGYWIAASGDFNNDGLADLIWTSNSRDLYLWTSTGSGFTAAYIGTYPAGWTLVGAADIDGDGYDDLIWENQSACEFGYWLMKGTQVVNRTTIAVTCGYHINFIETAFDSPNGTTPAIYWEGPANQNGMAAYYQWLPQSQTLNASLYATMPANWTYIAGMRQSIGPIGFTNQELMVFSEPTSDTTSTLLWTTNFDVDGAEGMSNLMAGYRVVAAGHFTGYCIPCGSQYQEILWTNAAGNISVWMLDTSAGTDNIVLEDILGSQGYSLPNFPASAGWYIVRPGVQN